MFYAVQNYTISIHIKSRILSHVELYILFPISLKEFHGIFYGRFKVDTFSMKISKEVVVSLMTLKYFIYLSLVSRTVFKNVCVGSDK